MKFNFKSTARQEYYLWRIIKLFKNSNIALTGSQTKEIYLQHQHKAATIVKKIIRQFLQRIQTNNHHLKTPTILGFSGVGLVNPQTTAAAKNPLHTGTVSFATNKSLLVISAHHVKIQDQFTNNTTNLK